MADLRPLPEPFPTSALAALLGTFATDHKRTNVIFGLLDEHLVWISHCATADGVDWASIIGPGSGPNIREFRSTDLTTFQFDWGYSCRPENKVSDSEVLSLWSSTRDSFTRALQHRLTTQQVLDLCNHAGGPIENRMLQNWFIDCACHEDTLAPPLVDLAATEANLTEYVNQPQCVSYFGAYVPLESAAERTQNPPLTQLFYHLTDRTRQLGNRGSSDCDVDDVRHILRQVVFLAFDTCDAITIYDWDPEGGLKERALSAAIGPFQMRISNRHSEVPKHVREFMASECALDAVACALRLVGLHNRMRPGAISEEDEAWLGNLHFSVLDQIITTAKSLVDNPAFGSQLRLVIQEGGPSLDNWLTAHDPLDAIYVAWQCYEFCQERDYESDSEDEDDALEDAPRNALVDVQLEAVGSPISIESVSSVSYETGKDLCPICLEDYITSTEKCMRLAGCGHQFHANCLHAWINGVFTCELGEVARVSCPCCRRFICDARPYVGRPD